MMIQRALLAAACVGLLLVSGCGEQKTVAEQGAAANGADVTPSEGKSDVVVELDDVTTDVTTGLTDAAVATGTLPEVRYYQLSDA